MKNDGLENSVEVDLRSLEKRAPRELGRLQNGVVTVLAAYTKDNVVFVVPPSKHNKTEEVFAGSFRETKLRKNGRPTLVLFFKDQKRPQIVELDWSQKQDGLVFSRFVRPTVVVGAGHPKVIHLIYKSGNPAHMISWCELPGADDNLVYLWKSRGAAYASMKKHVSAWAKSTQYPCLADLEKFARERSRWATHVHP